MDITQNIVSIRESKGLKQSEIASKIGIDQPNYSRLEKRGDKLSIEQLKAIATALDVPLNELLGLDAPVENEEKIKELENRIKELKKVVQVAHSKIDSYEFNLFMLSGSLGNEIVNFFSAANSGGSISQLYKLQDETPYCKLIRSDNTQQLILNYLNFKSRESEFLRSFYTSELFDMEILLDAMGNSNFITMNRENISTMVSVLLQKEWDEMVAEHERIANDPRTKKRNEET